MHLAGRLQRGRGGAVMGAARHRPPPPRARARQPPVEASSSTAAPDWRGVAGAALAAAAAVLVAAAPPALAETVRLADVDSPTLKAGLKAATTGRLVEAERLFKVFLTQEPDSASGWSNLGNVHVQMQLAALAVRDFDRAVALAPEAAVPRLNRAIAKEQLGVEAAAAGDAAVARALWGDALQDCDTAVELDPKEFAAWFDRGNIAMRLARWDQALVDFSTAADLAPGLAGYRLRQATLMFQQGDAGGARRVMSGIARKYGAYAEAHAALAAVEWDAGRAEAAEEQFSRAAALDADAWGSMDAIRAGTRWPPRLLDAMQRFLALEARPQSSGAAAGMQQQPPPPPV